MLNPLGPGSFAGALTFTDVAPTSVPRGEFHSHGAIINVSIGSTSHDVAVAGVTGFLGSPASTPATAFVLKPGGNGVAIRANGTAVASPFLWQASTEPPSSVSVPDGEDLFVETDCTDLGDCSSTGTEPHLMVYSATHCPSSNPWFDTVTGACRLP